MGNDNVTLMMTALFLGNIVLFLSSITTTIALTFESTQRTRSRLAEAFSSPSGKLTLTPEIIIEDPVNPTAILLQSSTVTTLSEALRTKAKANGVFLSCSSPSSLSSIRTFCNEQEEARGRFPGPIPVIYCGQSSGEQETIPNLTELVQAGVAGIVISISQQDITRGNHIGTNNISWIQKFHDAWQVGLQPIPEILVHDSVVSTWKEENMDELVAQITNVIGQDPVSILVTIHSDSTGDSEQQTGSVDHNDEKTNHVKPLPSISRALGKKIPILGSIRTLAGANRLGTEMARWKAAGFTGVVLRQECIPGYENKPNLEFVSDFWAACIGDLKSTRSKSFNFQSRNYLEKSVPVEWAKYQKSVIDSGALGEAEDNAPPGFNPDAGDYQGF
jgi:hypothetical protein